MENSIGFGPVYCINGPVLRQGDADNEIPMCLHCQSPL